MKMAEPSEDELLDAQDLEQIKVARTFVTENYGERCSDYSPNCGCCLAWTCFDFLFGYSQLDCTAWDKLRGLGKACEAEVNEMKENGSETVP